MKIASNTVMRALRASVGDADLEFDRKSIVRRTSFGGVEIEGYVRKENIHVEIWFVESSMEELGWSVDLAHGLAVPRGYERTEAGLQHVATDLAKVIPGIETIETAHELVKLWDGEWSNVFTFPRFAVTERILVRLKSAFMARDSVAVKGFFQGFLAGRYGRPDALTVRNVSVLVDDVIASDAACDISDARAEAFFTSFA